MSNCWFISVQLLFSLLDSFLSYGVEDNFFLAP